MMETQGITIHPIQGYRKIEKGLKGKAGKSKNAPAVF